MSKKLFFFISFVLSLGVAGNASAGNIAWNPFPADGAVCVDPDVVLSWLPGDCATQHDVYFGDNFDDVNNADLTTISVYKGRQSRGNETFPPGLLELCTTYYWRIDEICEYTIFAEALPDQVIVEPGYTIPGYIIVEAVPPDEACLVAHYEFEGDARDSSVNNFHGTEQGSPVYVAGKIGQALQFGGSDYVELPTGMVGSDIGSVCTWIKTTQSSRGMIFYGAEGPTSGNGYGPENELHVNMENGGGVDLYIENGGKIGTPPVNDDDWHYIAATWAISGNLMSLYVDGDVKESASHSGGNFNFLSGRIRLARPNENQCYYSGLMDDVRVYDCALSHGEVRYLAGVGDLVVPPVVVPPIYGPLVAHYEFEGDASDSSGNNLNGTLKGNASIIQDPAGVKDQVLTLYGNGDYVDCGNDPLFNPAGSFSISAWFNIRSLGDPWGNVIVSKRGENGVGWQLCRYGSSGKLTFTTGGLSNEHLPSTIAPALDEWHHIAAVYDGSKKVVYLDCDKDVEVVVSGIITVSGHNVYIGARAKDDNTGPELLSFFNGMIDDVRIYNYALSHGQVLFLGDCGNLPVTETWEGDVWSFMTCCPCDEIREYKNDIKWSQPPARYKKDPIYINGWDEVSSYDNSPIVADDWLCKDDMPIKDIHWWGSFKGWTECVLPEKMPDAFHLGIWTDVPDPYPRNPDTFSHPNELVWEKISDCHVWSFAGYDLDPRGIDPNEACFKFDQLLSQDEWFYQDPSDNDGTVYWLSIAAIYDGDTPEYPWGWKTRPHFYNDDAVRIQGLDGSQWPPTIGSVWESGEPIEYPEGTSWDMAFVLTANRKYKPLKWQWPHKSWKVREELMAADIYEDGRIDFKDLAVSANYWLEEAEWP